MKKKIATIVQHAKRHHDFSPNDARAIEIISHGVTSVNQLRIQHPEILKKSKAVANEIQKARGLAHFIPYKDFLIGQYHARHQIEDIIGIHFKKRYPMFNVITFNQASQKGTVSLARCTGPAEQASGLRAIGCTVQVGCDLFTFHLGHGETLDRFAINVVSLIHGPGDLDVNGDTLLDDSAFIKDWNAFYGSQCIDSRINYKYAMKMLGKRHVLDNLGHDSIVTQRVFKKIGKDQKTLMDFDKG